MLREAGAAEVHLRISSPPWRWPCFYGIDTPSHEELLATDHSVEEMAEHPGGRLAGLHQHREPEGGHRGRRAGSATPASPATTRRRSRPRRRPSRSGRPPAASAAAHQAALPGSEHCGAGRRHLRRRRRRHRGRRRRVERLRTMVAGIGGFGGQFPLDVGRYAHPVLVASTDGVGTKLVVARATGRYEYGRHRPGRHVRRRPGLRGGRAALPARLHRHGQGRPRPDRHGGGRRARGLPAGGLRADRRRDGGARRRHGTGRARPGRLRRRRGASRGPNSGPSGSARATPWSGWPRPGCAPTATPWPATCCWSGPASTSTTRRGTGPTTASPTNCSAPR